MAKAVDIKSDGTLIVKTRHYEDVKRVLVERGTSGTLFYADERPTGWISFKDAEPDKEGNYLVCFDDGFVATASYIDGDWELWADAGEVVAWMPLPKPYKAESEG